MSPRTLVLDLLSQIISKPTDGVIGLVDDLLSFCSHHNLRLTIDGDHCRVSSLGNDWDELVAIPLRKSVFRAILARIAVLCNERIPNSVSPYGGLGELVVNSTPSTMLDVKFENTLGKQALELSLRPCELPGGQRHPQDGEYPESRVSSL